METESLTPIGSHFRQVDSSSGAMSGARPTATVGSNIGMAAPVAQPATKPAQLSATAVMQRHAVTKASASAAAPVIGGHAAAPAPAAANVAAAPRREATVVVEKEVPFHIEITPRTLQELNETPARTRIVTDLAQSYTDGATSVILKSATISHAECSAPGKIGVRMPFMASGSRPSMPDRQQGAEIHLRLPSSVSGKMPLPDGPIMGKGVPNAAIVGRYLNYMDASQETTLDSIMGHLTADPFKPENAFSPVDTPISTALEKVVEGGYTQAHLIGVKLTDFTHPSTGATEQGYYAPRATLAKIGAALVETINAAKESIVPLNEFVVELVPIGSDVFRAPESEHNARLNQETMNRQFTGSITGKMTVLLVQKVPASA